MVNGVPRSLEQQPRPEILSADTDVVSVRGVRAAVSTDLGNSYGELEDPLETDGRPGGCLAKTSSYSCVRTTTGSSVWTA